MRFVTSIAGGERLCRLRCFSEGVVRDEEESLVVWD